MCRGTRSLISGSACTACWLQVAGARATGKVEPEYDVHECLAISEYPLSGAAALGRLTNAFENALGIV